jgi:hypothetical protein
MKVIASAVSGSGSTSGMARECSTEHDTPVRISQVRELISDEDRLACDDQTISRYLRAEKGHVKQVRSSLI